MSITKNPSLDIESLKNWFIEQKRDLPWRNNPSPYAVWISEVMLQQTQVAVVIPYFLRWMHSYPTIETLACAPLDEVIKRWEGLGYYSRARYLHEGAKYIVAHYEGQLPNEIDKLKQIKGLGPYTIGAILSFAFHQKKAAVDGNVIRVLSRYFALEDDVSKSTTIKNLNVLAEKLLPDEESWIVNEGLIELGATICQKKARCGICPLQKSCQGYYQGVVDRLPVKSKRVQTEFLYRMVAIIKQGEYYFVRKGKKGEIMQDLHEFPYFDVPSPGISSDHLAESIENRFGLKVRKIQELPLFSQSFTRYRVSLSPVIFTCQTQAIVENFEWLSLSTLKQLAFSSGHKRILENIQSLYI